MTPPDEIQNGSYGARSPVSLYGGDAGSVAALYASDGGGECSTRQASSSDYAGKVSSPEGSGTQDPAFLVGPFGEWNQDTWPGECSQPIDGAGICVGDYETCGGKEAGQPPADAPTPDTLDCAAQGGTQAVPFVQANDSLGGKQRGKQSMYGSADYSGVQVLVDNEKNGPPCGEVGAGAGMSLAFCEEPLVDGVVGDYGAFPGQAGQRSWETVVHYVGGGDGDSAGQLWRYAGPADDDWDAYTLCGQYYGYVHKVVSGKDDAWLQSMDQALRSVAVPDHPEWTGKASGTKALMQPV